MKKSPTASLVRDTILANPSLCDALARGIINISALARELLPRIQQKNPKATHESVAIALQRLEIPKGHEKYLREALKSAQLSMKSDVSIITVSRMQEIPALERSDLCIIHHGTEETTILVDTHNVAQFRGKAKNGLGVLSIRDRSKTYRTIPGYLLVFICAMSNQGINVLDIFTGKNGFRIVVEEHDLVRAYEYCKRAIMNF